MKGALEYFVQQYQCVSTRGIAVQNTPVNPTRFDSIVNNGYNVDAPFCFLPYYYCPLYVLPFIATLQFICKLRFLSTSNVSTLRFTVGIQFVCTKYANDRGLGFDSAEVRGAARATCSSPIY